MVESHDEGEKATDDEASKLTKSLLSQRVMKKQYPQGCQFSPDALCILSAEGNQLNLYNTNTTTSTVSDDWTPVLTCEGGDTVRSYQWYPHMNSSDPSTCCFLGVSRDQPVHLYDAYTGQVRASYRPYNALDEMESPTTLCFARNGQQLVTGGFRTDRMLHVFDLNRPGRDSSAIMKLGKTRRSKNGQKGLVSALAASDGNNVLAVGTYSPGSIYMYDLRIPSLEAAEIFLDGVCVVGHGKGHSKKRKHMADEDDDDDAINFSAAKIKWYQSRARGGVTQVEFSEDSNYLYSASRRSNAILQWDLRRLSSSNVCPGVASYATDSDTNQRLEFALWGEHLWVGGRDQSIRIYKQNDRTAKLLHQIEGFEGAVNGVSVTSLGEKTLVAASCGSRRFPTDNDWDQENPHQSLDESPQGYLQLYDIGI